MGLRGPPLQTLDELWASLLDEAQSMGDCVLVKGTRRRADARMWYPCQVADHIAHGPRPLRVRLRHTCARYNCINPAHIVRITPGRPLW